MSQKLISIILVIVASLFIFSSLSLADGELIINIGEDFILPDDDFGVGDTMAGSSKGTLTGQIGYVFSSITERKDSLLNQEGILFTLPDKEHDFDLQLDYNYDLGEDGRIFVSANFTEDRQSGKDFEFDFGLKEAFVSHGFQDYGNLILGKQKLNIGNGFGWTPTGIHSSSQITIGLFSGRWSLSYEGFTFMTVLVPPLADVQNEKGLLYERIETNLGSVNLALSGLIREEGKPRVGLDVATFIGDIELYTAVSVRQENLRTYLTEDTTPDPFGDELKTYNFTSREDEDWYLYGLVGSSYTIPGTETYLMAEYFYDQTGLTRDEIQEIGDAAEYCLEMMEDERYQVIGMDKQYLGYLGMLNQNFTPGQMGKHYLFLGVREVQLLDAVSGNIYGIVNLADRSCVINPEVSYALNGNTDLIITGNLLFGEEKTEYGLGVMERKISLKTVTLF